ncbi:MAG TPA: hypothetical protein PKW18_03285 [Candidatus Sumerlaeota bacterium]|nr:hypothetical protein [Candidatus Sumerlaeota bacterium]
MKKKQKGVKRAFLAFVKNSLDKAAIYPAPAAYNYLYFNLQYLNILQWMVFKSIARRNCRTN